MLIQTGQRTQEFRNRNYGIGTGITGQEQKIYLLFPTKKVILFHFLLLLLKISISVLEFLLDFLIF
jgi:hypothetical protein